MIETGHTDNISDVAADSTGRLLATGCVDGSIKVFNTAETAAPLCTLEGHEGVVVRLAWGPPKISQSPLVSLGADGKLILWKEMNSDTWSQIYTRQFPEALTAVSWAPQEYGEMLACATADGKIHVLHKAIEWSVSNFDAHPTAGCTGISWAPCLPPGGLLQLPFSKQQQQQSQPYAMPFPRMVTSGNERSVRVWRYAPHDKQWVQETELPDLPARCITDVCWAPNVGVPFSYIAAGTDEGDVCVWVQDGYDGRWKARQLQSFSEPISRLSWSYVGTFLLVTCENSSTTMWKESQDGKWIQVSTIVDD